MEHYKTLPRLYAERFYVIAGPLLLLIGLFHHRGHTTIAYAFAAFLVLLTVNKVMALGAARRARRDAER